MRSILSFILIVSGIYLAPAQGFVPLLNTNKSWSSVDEYYKLVFMGQIRVYHHFLDGDTIIGQVSYNKIYEINDQSSQTYLIGYIREDTTGKVFYRSNDGNEGIIYDFGVDLNDTIDVYVRDHNTGFQAVVKEFGVFSDSLLTRRTIVLHGIELWNVTETWIEGIGSNLGLLESGTNLSGLVGGEYELLCFTENDTLKYLNPRFTGCSNPRYVGLDAEKWSGASILIYPNPVVDEAICKIPGPLSDQFVIDFFDPTGRVIHTKQLLNTDMFTINRSDLYEGIIFYRIRAKNLVVTGNFQVINR